LTAPTSIASDGYDSNPPTAWDHTQRRLAVPRLLSSAKRSAAFAAGEWSTPTTMTPIVPPSRPLPDVTVTSTEIGAVFDAERDCRFGGS
jgi:hypothetical protein